MLASAPAEHYRRALETLLSDEHVDSVITIFIPATRDRSRVSCDCDRRGCPHRGTDKPVLGVFMQTESAPEALAPIPAYAFPESAALALARVTTYGRWRATQVEAAPELDHFDRDRIRSIVEGVLARGGGWATAGEATALLAAAGIEYAASSVAADLEQAVLARHPPSAIRSRSRRSGRRCSTRPNAPPSRSNLVDEAACVPTYADFAPGSAPK